MNNFFDIDQLNSHLPLNIDAYICCASYEDRCLVLAGKLPLERVGKAAIFINENISKYNSENALNLSRRFQNTGIKIGIDSTKPMLTADKIYEFLKALFIGDQPAKNCVVDITTFTHEALLILFKVVHDLKRPQDRITFFYVGADEYAIGLPQKEKWLSKGVSEIRSVLGYAGELLPSKKNHLVVIVGYEHERASQLIASFEPNKITLAYGKAGSSTSEENHAANLYFHKLLLKTASIYSNVSELEISCNNPLVTKQEIMDCIDANSDYNTIVVPMNTKLSTIACALVSIIRPSVQLCYAQPLQYNYLHYSKPGRNCYFIDYDSLFGAGE